MKKTNYASVALSLKNTAEANGAILRSSVIDSLPFSFLYAVHFLKQVQVSLVSTIVETVHACLIGMQFLITKLLFGNEFSRMIATRMQLLVLYSSLLKAER